MTTKLTLFNDALLLVGERFLASLTEEVESRRLLDRAYDGAVKFCLERAQWSFATRTIQLDYDSGMEPDFGYRRAFTQPEDWCGTKAMCSDEFFRVPLLRVQHEANIVYADEDTIYWRYVSTDPLYGFNLSQWPETFKDVVACHLAMKVAPRLAKDQGLADILEKKRDRLMDTAKNDDARREPTQFPAPGAWGQARTRASGSNDGGGRGSLIG